MSGERFDSVAAGLAPQSCKWNNILKNPAKRFDSAETLEIWPGIFYLSVFVRALLQPSSRARFSRPCHLSKNAPG